MQKEWQIFLQKAVTTRKEDIEWGSKAGDSQKGNHSSYHFFTCKYDQLESGQAKRLFSCDEFSVKVMKRVGWEEGGFSNFTPAVSTPVV